MFFRRGISEEEYNYVLDGEKPISVRNFYSLDDFPFVKDLDHVEREFTSTLLIREMIPIWKKCCSQQDKFVLKATPLNQTGEPELGWEVQFIHLPKLEETIEKNIDLFRYILGPSVDSRQLAHEIAHSEKGLIDILNNDCVLIGIVLGFGSHNSLLGGRKDKISTVELSRDLFPFSPKSLSMQSKEHYFGYYLDAAGGDHALLEFQKETLPLKPSIGLMDLEEEHKFIDHLHEPLPVCLNENQPVFIFGAYKKGPSNQPLFKRLKKSQKEAQALSQKKDFLESVLKKISGEKPIIACNKVPSKPLSLAFFKDRLPLNTWVHILNKTAHSFKDKKHQLAFLEAFSQPTASLIPPQMVGVTEATLKGLNIALKNLSKTNVYFETLSQDTSLQTLVPNQLYYKTIVRGNGKELKGDARIRVKCLFEDIEGNLLFANQDTWMTLSQTIQGLSWGLQSMRVGETRQILVHPSLSYGALTTLPPCTGLNIKIELVEVDKKFSGLLPALKPLDLEWIKDPDLYDCIEKSLHQKPIYMGSFLRRLIDKIEGPDKAITLISKTDV